MIGFSELFLFVFIVPFMLIGLGLLIFWLLMLIDCLKRPDDKFAYIREKSGNHFLPI
ncbi:Uncharacterised protein [uncultured archaeon]|nr:Uncharacterised protein [uncultured archaeon]